MRWLILLLVPLGLQGKEVEIHCTDWYEGRIAGCESAIIGEILRVESHVERSASQVLPEESCVIQIDEIVGHSPELEGAKTARLMARYIHDLYLQLAPDWGVYRHLEPGQKVVALIHRYEHDLAIGSEALIVLKPETMALPEIIKRTGMDLTLFTNEDLAVWKAAWPQMFPELADRAAYERERIEEERRMGDVTPVEWLTLAVTASALLAVGMWLARRCLITRSSP